MLSDPIALWIVRRLRFKRLEFRQAQRFRSSNASFAIIVTSLRAGSDLCVYLRSDLRANFVQAYPEDAPNLFSSISSPTNWKSFPN